MFRLSWEHCREPAGVGGQLTPCGGLWFHCSASAETEGSMMCVSPAHLPLSLCAGRESPGGESRPPPFLQHRGFVSRGLSKCPLPPQHFLFIQPDPLTPTGPGLLYFREGFRLPLLPASINRCRHFPTNIKVTVRANLAAHSHQKGIQLRTVKHE